MIDENENENVMLNNPMDRFGNGILTLTSTKPELKDLELTFRGLRSDGDGNLVPVGIPLMNDYGVNSIIGTIQSLMNRVTVLSNLDKNEVSVLMDFISDTLARDLMINRKSYAINSHAARDKVYFSALSSVFVTLKRGFMEGDRRFLKGSTQENIIRQERAPERRNIFSSWRNNN